MKQKIAVVTGGGAGIGRAISQRFAKEGYFVVIADIDTEAASEAVQQMVADGGKAMSIPTDVALEHEVEALAQQVTEQLGRIDVLINNAGIGHTESLYNISIESFDRVLAVNLRGAFLCSKKLAPLMKKSGGGSIINLSSTRAFMSEPHTEAYSASKGGILSLTHAMAISLGPDRIRVNAICPGWIETSEWQKSSKATLAHHTEGDKKQHPVGRVGIPEDVAEACIYLSSAGFITGQHLTIDGGMTVKMIYV